MKTVLFITKCKFPLGDASSKRYDVLSRYFIDRGFSPVFIGMGSTKYKQKEIFDNKTIISLRKYQRPNLIQKFLNHFRINEKITKYAAANYSNSDVVFVDPRLFKVFRRYRKRFISNNIIYSVVEFYSPSEYLFGGFFSQSYRDNVSFNNNVTPADGKIIAISSYLKKHFMEKGFRVVRIPFAVDNRGTNITESKKSDKTGFIYCGNPRNKDRLSDILLAFSRLDSAILNKTIVNVYGVNAGWIDTQKQLRNIKDRILSFCNFCGYIPYEMVSEKYSNSDFSLLLRPMSERYSKAGFPTKISESLEHGVPPITNFTSDLSLYLKNLINCIEVKGDDYVSFSEALMTAFSLDDSTINAMKKEAKKTSIEKLDITCFYNELDYLVND